MRKGFGAVEEIVMKAKGRWPLRASGMPTTQHSATAGCENMTCSMDPRERVTFVSGFLRFYVPSLL